MMDYAQLQSLIIALAIGFLIGMQRTLAYPQESKGNFAGTRTFALIALTGYLSGWLQTLLPSIYLITGGGLILFLSITYTLKVIRTGHWGMTTHIAALVTWLLGLLVWTGKPTYAFFIGVVVIILLEVKPRLQALERHIGMTDIHAVTLLLAMTFVILPVLPDRMVDPWHLFNPYKTWMMAVIIAAISFIGYVAIKVLGQKHGVFLTGAAGGLISSTAVSITLSQMFQKQWDLINNYAGGIAIACTFMYLRVLFEAFVIDPTLAGHLAPAYLGATVTGLLFSGWLYRHAREEHIALTNDAITRNPLQLSEAIKFGLLFGIIYGAITLVQNRYGDLGVYLVSFFSGLTDVDAITLSLSQMTQEGKLTETAAMYGVAIASATNSVVKLGIVFVLGGRKLGWRMSLYFLVTLGAMGLGLLWVGKMG